MNAETVNGGSTSCSRPWDGLCVRFESEIRAGAWPRIEEYLDLVQESERGELVAELLAIEIEYRREQGVVLDPKEYVGRFPDYSPVIESIYFDTQAKTTDRPVSADAHVAVSASPAGRFRVLHPHAEGGLGVVSIAFDEELSRKVALKELKPGRREDYPSQRRFVLEAKINGGLEHPGIVPVYGSGSFPDGRPYYAMRFVAGENLGESIRRFHKMDKSPRNAGNVSLQLRKLLRRFIDVCNAIHYAHSRGILHRDLKPSNIMLGKYGETLVVDWGLAKALSRRMKELSHVSTLRPYLDDELDPTRVGTVLGTPAYMSPEQAAGQTAGLGPAADIYALGATMYVLLVGQPPFSGDSVRRILERVQEGRLARPRSLLSTVPRGLEAICLKAMSHSPAERYTSAADLADDVEHWLADEPVKAYTESMRERLSRWLRRNKAWAQAGSIALVIVALVSSVLTLIANSARRGEEQQKQAATNYFHIALDSMNEMVLAPKDDPLMKNPQFVRIRHEVLGAARKFYLQLSRSRGDSIDLTLARARAYDKLALIAREIEGVNPAYHLEVKCVSLLRPLAEAQPDNDEIQYWLAAALSNTARYTDDLGNAISAEVLIREAMEIVERLIAKPNVNLPGDVNLENQLAHLYFHLGSIFLWQYRFDELFDAYDRVEVSVADGARQDDDSTKNLLHAVSHNKSVLNLYQNRFADALAGFEGALKQWEVRAAAGEMATTPNVVRAMIGKANVYVAQGQLNQAEATCRSVIDRLAEYRRKFPDHKEFTAVLLEAQIILGTVYTSRWELDKAKPILDEAELTRNSLSADDVPLAGWRRMALWIVQGQLYQRLGKPDLAVEHYRYAKDALDDPMYRTRGSGRSRLVNVHCELASILIDRGQNAEAEKLLTVALKTYEYSREIESRVPDAIRGEAVAHRMLAALNLKLEKESEGVVHLERSRDILESLVTEFPDVPWYWIDLAETRWQLGQYHHTKGDLNAASAEFQREAVLREQLMGWQPEVAKFRERLVAAICRDGLTLRRLADLDGAIREFERAIEIAPDSAEGYGRLADVLATTPDTTYRDGSRALRAAIRANELTKWQDWRQLAVVAAAYAEVGDFKTAHKYNSMSIELAPPEQRSQLRLRGQRYAADKPYRSE